MHTRWLVSWHFCSADESDVAAETEETEKVRPGVYFHIA